MKRRRPKLSVVLALAWLVLIAFIGVFAPFLSSSMPLPDIVRYLRPMDIALPLGAILACIGALVPARSSTHRFICTIIPMAVALLIGAACEAARAPMLRVYDAEAPTGPLPAHPFSPDDRIAGARFAHPSTETPDGRTFILGADSRGQDVVAQLIHGCRTALLVSAGSAMIAMTIGITLGALMGWFRSWVDVTLMRFVEGAMSIPVLLILVVAAGVLPRELGITILVIGLVTWTDAARLTRAEFLRLREQDFIAAARATGASPFRIITLHLLPSALPPLLVEGSFALAAAILYEASLSFLGLGPTEGASWGRLLAQGLDPGGRPLWWITVPAGLMIFLTVVSLHALGDTLRRRLAHTLD